MPQATIMSRGLRQAIPDEFTSHMSISIGIVILVKGSFGITSLLYLSAVSSTVFITNVQDLIVIRTRKYIYGRR